MSKAAIVSPPNTVCVTIIPCKVAIKILQGSVVTQTMLGGLTAYHPIADFL